MPALVIGLILACAGFLWPTTASLLLLWRDTSDHPYSHGYLVAAISSWMLWRNRVRLANVPARPFYPAFVAVLLLLLSWLVAVRAGIQTLHQVLLPILFWSAILAVLGCRVALACALAIGYLYFAIPIWDVVNFILKAMTVRVTDFAIQLSGITAHVSGNIVSLPSGVFEIADACSGLHYFIVAFAVAVLYGEVNRDTFKVRLELIALSLTFALLANWIRVYVIVLAGYLTDMQHYLVKVEHIRFGWVVFAITMFGFFMVARRLPVSELPSGEQVVQCKGTDQPVPWRAAMVALMLVASVSAWNLVVGNLAAPLPSHGQLMPTFSSARLNGPLPASHFNWLPQFHGADIVVSGRYSTGGYDVEMYRAVYASQRQGKELVAYDNSIFGAEKVDVLNESVVDGWREFQIATAVSHELVRYQYRIGTTRTPDGLRAQLSYGIRSLMGAPLSEVVAFRTACKSDCAGARTRINALADALGRNPGSLP